MKKIIACTLFALVAFSSCSFLKKNKSSHQENRDSSSTQTHEFVEYKGEQKTVNIKSGDSNSTQKTWQVDEQTTIQETFDSSGKVTNRTTTKNTKASGTQDAKGYSWFYDHSEIKDTTSTTIKGSTQTSTSEQIREATSNTTRWGPSPAMLCAGVALLALLYYFGFNPLAFLVGIFKRKKQN